METSPPLNIIAGHPTISTARAEAQSYTHGATTQLFASWRTCLNDFFAMSPIPF
jgi:hypothetical protein